MAKQPRILLNEVLDGVFVKVWKEKQEFIVQVWLSGKPEGQPEGDWAMPAALGPVVCIAQAILQTRQDAKK